MKLEDSSKLLLPLSIIGLVVGGFFALQELFVEPVFASNDGIVWTLPLVTYFLLALTSAGLAVILSCGELIQSEAVLANKRIILSTSIATLVGAFAAIAVELGSILNMVWMILSPNLKSPIWWMGALYSIELVLLGIKFTSMMSGQEGKSSTGLNVATCLVAAAAAMVLGSAMGTASVRVGFGGADASVLTLMCALVSGFCLVGVLVKAHERLALVNAQRAAFAALIVFLLVQYVYQVRSTVPSQNDWVYILMPVLLLVAAWLYTNKPVIALVIGVPVILWVELAFVVQAQMEVLGPNQTWLGTTQTYVPNVAEVGILLMGCSIAYLCYYVLAKLETKGGLV